MRQLVYLIALLCFLPCMAAGSKKEADFNDYTIVLGASSKKQRVLQFPKDHAVGGLQITPWPPSAKNVTRRVVAIGTVVVPAGNMVKFVPGDRCYKDPDIFKALPADGIDSLQLGATSLYTDDAGMCDDVLLHIGNLTGLIELDLNNSDATDKGLAYAAARLPNLQTISAVATQIEGKCFSQFEALKQLHLVRLTHTIIPDENLRYLANLPQLEYLNIGHCRITDKGVKNLTNCKRLTYLGLSGNKKITDQSIKTLLGMKDLHIILLSGTSMTASGILQLKKLPLLMLDVPSWQLLERASTDFRKAFPGVNIKAPGDSTHVDSDTDAVFAPLH